MVIVVDSLFEERCLNPSKDGGDRRHIVESQFHFEVGIFERLSSRWNQKTRSDRGLLVDTPRSQC